MKIAVIGAGFGGLSAAAYLAKAGHDVHVYEKNDQPGGRAMVVKDKGFTFDLGPSWYLMPDIFEEFFADFGKKPSDYYDLTQLTPSYRVFFDDEQIDVRPAPAAYKDFESIEPGSGPKLAKHLRATAKEYTAVRRSILTATGLDVAQYSSMASLKMAANPALLTSFHRRIKKVVTDERLQQILEFMVVFLGGSPRNIPALYGLLNWTDFGLGVWYPQGGFGAVARAFELVAKEQGVTIHYNSPVHKIHTEGAQVVAVELNDAIEPFDAAVANSDYAFTEMNLLSHESQSYDETYWRKKTLSPSAVLGVIGVDRRVPLQHHNLFFDTDWDGNFNDVFTNHRHNEKPLFYASAPSVSDASVAPKGHENIFILIPVTNQQSLSPDKANNLVENAIARIGARTSVQINDHIVTKQVLGPDYFKDTFNAYNGNAFGLSHTLAQTGPLRPRIQSKKVTNLYYTGQFTNPGTGVPLVVLSGKIVANYIGQSV